MLGRESEICHVTSESAAVNKQAVLLGGTYKAEITLAAGDSLTVTMNGKDVTSSCVKGGKIEIAEVSGDVTVRIKRAPRTFRWELEDDVFDTVDSETYTQNKRYGVTY